MNDILKTPPVAKNYLWVTESADSYVQCLQANIIRLQLEYGYAPDDLPFLERVFFPSPISVRLAPLSFGW